MGTWKFLAVAVILSVTGTLYAEPVNLTGISKNDNQTTAVSDQDQYLERAKVEAANLNPMGIGQVVDEVRQKFPGSILLLKVLLIQADFANSKSGNSAQAIRSYREMVKIAPKSLGAATARLRLADMILHGQYDYAIEDYKSILHDFPQLSVNAQGWAWSQIAIIHYQMGDTEKAKTEFQTVLNLLKDTPNNPRVKTAEFHLYAFNHPDSIEALLCLYDRAIRHKQFAHRDVAWADLRTFVDKAESEPAFESYCNNPEISLGERAQMRYRKAFALFEAIDHERAITALNGVQEMLGTAPGDQRTSYPENVTYYEAQFMEAYHHMHHGHYSHSAMILREMLDESNCTAELIPKAYKELILDYRRDKDYLGASLAAEEFLILYPYRIEAEVIKDLRKRLLDDYPQIAAGYQEGKKTLLAKYGTSPKDLNIAINNPEPRKLISAAKGGN